MSDEDKIALYLRVMSFDDFGKVLMQAIHRDFTYFDDWINKKKRIQFFEDPEKFEIGYNDLYVQDSKFQFLIKALNQAEELYT